MSEAKEIKKILISEETFETLKQEEVEKLREKKDVDIVILSQTEVLSHFIHNTAGVAAVILSKTEQKDLLNSSGADFNLPEDVFEQRIKEIKRNLEPIEFKIPELPKLPEMIPASYIYNEQKNKVKPYVPRCIGTPNNKKRGGR
ncbi:MAG: hypothetical protein IJ870_06210 [Alphaproteobacteria bacterium]|nr:hypothetical protein [Alphaproteobacteria bacterium]